MSESDSTTTGRGVLVLLAIAAAIVIALVGFTVGDSLLSYINIGD